MITAALQSSPYAVIVGAGPYGLSLAAHLREVGVPFRIFGTPMKTWRTQMPAGMKLKSDSFASNLSSGSSPFTLEDFCRLTGREYHAKRIPISVEDFIAYGLEFARRFVPNLEQSDVTSIERQGSNFRVTIVGGESFHTCHVILATGISVYQHMPSKLAELPKDMITHSSDHRLFEEFTKRDITVLGRGASSLNAAVVLHETGAQVTLITKKKKIYIHTLGPERIRSTYERLRHPSSPIGDSLRSWLLCNAPRFYHALPAVIRRLLIYKHLGPAGGSALEGRVLGKFPILLGWSIVSAELMNAATPKERRIRLTLVNAEHERLEHITSHIIAGTGYRVDLARLRFLCPSLRAQIRIEKDGYPRLNRHFESSVKGLYFIGPAASGSFGLFLRFVAGAGYASNLLTQQFVREYERVAVSGAGRGT